MRFACAPALAEPFAFFGSHLVPLLTAAAPSAIPSARTPAAEQDTAEKQQPESLPEADQMPSKDLWHQGVPQTLDDKSEYSSDHKYKHQNF